VRQNRRLFQPSPNSFGLQRNIRKKRGESWASPLRLPMDSRLRLIRDPVAPSVHRAMLVRIGGHLGPPDNPCRNPERRGPSHASRTSLPLHTGFVSGFNQARTGSQPDSPDSFPDKPVLTSFFSWPWWEGDRRDRRLTHCLASRKGGGTEFGSEREVNRLGKGVG